MHYITLHILCLVVCKIATLTVCLDSLHLYAFAILALLYHLLDLRSNCYTKLCHSFNSIRKLAWGFRNYNFAYFRKIISALHIKWKNYHTTILFLNCLEDVTSEEIWEVLSNELCYTCLKGIGI